MHFKFPLYEVLGGEEGNPEKKKKCLKYFEFEYAYFNNLQLEHRYFKCEVCSEVGQSKHTYRQHKIEHSQLEFDVVRNKCEHEKETEYKKDRDLWVRGLANKSIGFFV